jgi:hypothetical protein
MIRLDPRPRFLRQAFLFFNPVAPLELSTKACFLPKIGQNASIGGGITNAAVFCCLFFRVYCGFER